MPARATTTLRCSFTGTEGDAEWSENFAADVRLATLWYGQTGCTLWWDDRWHAGVNLGGGVSRAWSEQEGRELGQSYLTGHLRVVGGWESRWLALAVGAVASPRLPHVLVDHWMVWPVYRLRLGPRAFFFHSGLFDGGFSGTMLHAWSAGVGGRWTLVDDVLALEALAVGHDWLTWSNAWSLALRVLGPRFGVHVELHRVYDPYGQDKISLGDRDGFSLSVGIDYPGVTL